MQKERRNILLPQKGDTGGRDGNVSFRFLFSYSAKVWYDLLLKNKPHPLGFYWLTRQKLVKSQVKFHLHAVGANKVMFPLNSLLNAMHTWLDDFFI